MLADLLNGIESWHIRGFRKKATFRARISRLIGRNWHFASVVVRQQTGETIDEMITRGCAELHRRMADGMPVTPPKVIAQRNRRKAIDNFRRSPVSSQVN